MNKWIKCRDAFPDCCKWVLTYADDHPIMPMTANHLRTDGQWANHCNKNITHWMNLPDAPDVLEKRKNTENYQEQLRKHYE